MAKNSSQNKVLLTHRLYGLSTFYSLSLCALYLSGHHDQGQGSCGMCCCDKVVTQDLSAEICYSDPSAQTQLVFLSSEGDVATAAGDKSAGY